MQKILDRKVSDDMTVLRSKYESKSEIDSTSDFDRKSQKIKPNSLHQTH